MDFLLGGLLVIAVLYFANQGGLAFLGSPAPAMTPLSPVTGTTGAIAGGSPGAAPSSATGSNPTGLVLQGGISVGTSLAPAGIGALGLTGVAATAATAGVGALAAIGLALFQAHEIRKKQAINENSAVNVGRAGWDSDLAQINAAFNARRLTAGDAIQLVNQAWAGFWQLVTPQIQPGRNGCAGGSACPPYAGCSGSIGAACCVGCYDLAGSQETFVFSPAQGGDGVTAYYFGYQGTIIVLQEGGGTVFYQAVVSSTYGVTARPAYKLTWAPVAVA